MNDIPNDLRRRLEQFGQGHVLAGWQRLNVEERRHLVDQLGKLDLKELQRLYAERQVRGSIPELSRLAPLPQPEESAAELQRYHQLGEEALRAGAVAYLVVAGGQGTRLGFDHPKGMFPIGPVSGKSLYQLHAEKVLALRRRYRSGLPLLVMTSPATHDETVQFFREHDQFGLGDTVRFFCQGTMPALDFDSGKLLMERPAALSLSPNGHGGILAALRDARMFDFVREHGARTIYYFQVDNPLTNLGDAVFIGRHVAHRAEASTKVLPKKHPKEKMGNLVLVDGRCSIIEYSDLPDDWTTLTDPHPPPLSQQARGELRLFFWGGNTAIHLFDVEFLRRMSEETDSIPWHLARKKVPLLGPDGQAVEPKTENALKFEKFIFDVLPLAERWTVVATERAREFAPLKNATGDDSIDTARSALIDVAATWLEQAGATVARDAHGKVVPVEISPLFALDAAEIKAKIKPGLRIEEATYFE